MVPIKVSAPVSCNSLCPSCLSNFGDSSLPCNFTSMTDLRGVVEFSVCLDFYLLLD